MANCDVGEMVDAGACFCALDRKQQQIVTLTLLCQILQHVNPMASCDPQELLEAGACFCAADAKQMQIIQTQLLCEILQGGAVGQTCLICGDAGSSPPADAPCDCSIYYTRPPNPGMWMWDSTNSIWEMVIAPGP